MRPTERRESGQHDFLRSRLDRIVDPAHPLVKLGARSTGGSSRSASVRPTRIALAVLLCRHG